MIAISGSKKDGAPYIVLALSRENTTKLHQSMPISVNLEELGFGPGEIIIFAGETEAELKKTLEPLGFAEPSSDEKKGSS